MIVGVPGPGGALGQCQVCGGSFLAEILTKKSVPIIKLGAFEEDMAIHDKCVDHLETAKAEGWESLPEGPIRKAFAKAAEQKGESE